MGLYNIVGASSLVAGQPEDVGQVLANYQAIQAVLNGGIDDINIRASAAISASKLNAYPNDQTKYLAGDGIWRVPGTAPTRTPGTHIFTASGTFTTPANARAILVECLGGGGTGGQAQTGSQAYWAVGAGGWGGDYAVSLIQSPAASYGVIVGAGGVAIPSGGTAALGNNGGDSVFGASAVLAKGGRGGTQDQFGAGGPHTVNIQPAQSGSIGDFVTNGGMPGIGFHQSGNMLVGGRGGAGAAPYGGPGALEVTAAGGTAGGNAPGGTAPNTRGAGSSGSTAGNYSAGCSAVAAGTAGIVVVTVFY